MSYKYNTVFFYQLFDKMYVYSEAIMISYSCELMIIITNAT